MNPCRAVCATTHCAKHLPCSGSMLVQARERHMHARARARMHVSARARACTPICARARTNSSRQH
eukprot:6211228-Pleurochrysis_carterae.AAC.3